MSSSFDFFFFSALQAKSSLKYHPQLILLYVIHLEYYKYFWEVELISQLLLRPSYSFFAFAPWHVLYLAYCIGCINYSCHHGSVTSWEQTDLIFLIAISWYPIHVVVAPLRLSISLNYTVSETCEPTKLKKSLKTEKDCLSCWVFSSSSRPNDIIP